MLLRLRRQESSRGIFNVGHVNEIFINYGVYYRKKCQ